MKVDASRRITANMTGIGMNFAAVGNPSAEIEQTLLEASELGMDGADFRVLSLLSTWIEIHSEYINADRLVRLVHSNPSMRVRAYWAATATRLSKDRRFARLLSSYDGPRVDLLPVGNDFQIERRGEDPRFENTALRAPAGCLRDRAADVLSPEQLARRHPEYKERVLMGAAQSPRAATGRSSP